LDALWKTALSEKMDFYLMFRSGPNPASSLSKLSFYGLRTPKPGEKTELFGTGEDIRDPKFAVIENQLHLYALKNVSLLAQPCVAIFSGSAGGKTWQSWQDGEPARLVNRSTDSPSVRWRSWSALARYW
jgi:hypothetical protein